jgi:His/Glu/Gln/Arg/opine family amino acid ABC transporter permease subunit
MKLRPSQALQVAFIAGLAALVAAMAMTAHQNLARQGVATGFSFLFESTGWDVSASFLPHSSSDPYWWTFVVGLSNTIVLSIVCIVLATAAGVVFALIGAGQSRILHGFTRLYVWVFRNTPLIVQVFFWYHVTRQLPSVREAQRFLDCCYASNRGIYLPRLQVGVSPFAVIAIAIAIGLAIAALRRLNARRANAGLMLWGPLAIGAVVFAAAAVAALATVHFDVALPRLQGFNFVDASYVSPEFMALMVAIIVYNTAFITEIVNSGIRAVPRSQIEAARIIGLSTQRTFWTITIPQAIRVAVPALINQYISLTKSTSLAIAIGYTDLFSTGVIAINHTGQAINVIAVLMLVYLAISIGISALGNAYNRAILGRDAR